MRHQFIPYILSLMLLCGLASCDETLKEDLYIPIKSVRATASVDLSNRADWKLYVNDKPYKTVAKGRMIVAQPKSEKEVAYFVIYAKEDKSSNVNTVMSFLSPHYDFKNLSLAFSDIQKGRVSPEVLDQSSADKMDSADVLSVTRKGIATPHLENVKLEHRHSLIDYTFDGLPQDAKVKLLSVNFEVKPQTVENTYLAVLQYPQLAFIEVETAGKVYTVSLNDYFRKLSVEKRQPHDMHYTFVVNFDTTEGVDEDELLTLKNIEATKWSKEDLAAHDEPSSSVL